MAFHHHQNHHHRHPAATSHCCCCPQPPSPPPPSLQTADPYEIAVIVSHILQIQTQTLNQTPPNLHNFCSQIPKPTSTNRNQRCPRDQFQNPQSDFVSLLQRIDALEQALHRYSSASSLSIRDVAARTIQTHFRVYLVRRSRALGQLKDLASIKTAIGSLKSCFSRRGFVDFDSLSSRAMELLLLLDTIQGEDKMIIDSKRSITNEIAQFLDLVDGVCVRRHQVVTKTTRNARLMRNDNSTSHDHARQFSERGVGPKYRNVNNDGKKPLGNLKGRVERELKYKNMSYDVLENLKGRDARGSKCRNMSDDEKKLLENLKGRVERIGRLSREIDIEEEDAQMEGYNKHDAYEEEEDDDVIVGNLSNHRMENRGFVKNHLSRPDGKKYVSFEEDDNVVRVYDVDDNTSSDVNEGEDDAKGVHDEGEDDDCMEPR